MLKCSRPIK